jgi:ADP-ribosylglycohydrolase
MENMDKIRATILGSFVGDAMSLGTHFVDDQDAIKEKYGRIETLIKPELATFHQNVQKGDFTHIGDQAYELLIETSLNDSFDQITFGTRFRCLFKNNYKGHIDEATQKTLDVLCGYVPFHEGISRSSNLCGAARIAPLFMAYGENLDALHDAVASFVSYTHEEPRVINTGKFFAEVVYTIIHESIGAKEAIDKVMATEKYENIASMIQQGLDSVERDSSEVVRDFGLGCDIEGALASTIHMIVKYTDDYKEAIIQNTMAGGDSAGRGMIIGMVLGAALGADAIPKEWLEGLVRLESLEGYIARTKRLHYHDYDRVS